MGAKCDCDKKPDETLQAKKPATKTEAICDCEKKPPKKTSPPTPPPKKSPPAPPPPKKSPPAPPPIKPSPPPPPPKIAFPPPPPRPPPPAPPKPQIYKPPVICVKTPKSGSSKTKKLIIGVIASVGGVVILYNVYNSFLGGGCKCIGDCHNCGKKEKNKSKFEKPKGKSEK